MSDPLSFCPEPPDWLVPWDDIDSAFAWIRDLRGCTQDAVNHGEGDVWNHVRMVCECGQPECDRGDIDRGIANMWRLGVRTMFVAHWVDNALAGAALEEGDKGTFISAMQVRQTGQPLLIAYGQPAACFRPAFQVL